jgi:hypothetical protein
MVTYMKTFARSSSCLAPTRSRCGMTRRVGDEWRFSSAYTRTAERADVTAATD